MKCIQNSFAALCFAFAQCAFAQYGTPASLKAELREGGELLFATEAKELGAFSNLHNNLFSPPRAEAEKLPGLVIFHTCAGVRPHLRYWTEQALKEGYVVLVPDAMRGVKIDCGSPPQISNARLVKDALDAVAHLAVQPYVDVNLNRPGY